MREPGFSLNDETARKSGVWVAGAKAKVASYPGLECHYCTRPAENRDHVVPKKRGGVNSWWNLVQSCVKCNSRKAHLAPSCHCPFCRRAVALWMRGARREGYDLGLLRIKVRRARYGWSVQTPSAFGGVPFVSYWPTWESAMGSLDKAKKGV